MTPRRSIVGQMARLRLFDRWWKRGVIFVIPILVLLFLSAFPERFRAEATLTPADPSTLGLSDTLGQLGALNSVFGKQAEVEVALRIGTSVYTRQSVIDQLDLEERLSDVDVVDVHRWLDRNVTVRSLRGGIILVQMDLTDRVLAEDIVGAYIGAIRSRLAEVTERQTTYKREVLEQLVADAGDKLSQAQATYNDFRLRNGYADPETTLEVVSIRVPELRAELEEIDRQITTARNLYTDNNIVVEQLLSQRAEVAGQLQGALSRETSAQGNTVGEAVSASTRLFELERELQLAQSLYTNYLRYLEGTTVENLTSTANIRVLEQPYVATERQFRWSLVAAALALFLLWMAMEFYRLRPPLGARLDEADERLDRAERRAEEEDAWDRSRQAEERSADEAAGPGLGNPRGVPAE